MPGTPISPSTNIQEYDPGSYRGSTYRWYSDGSRDGIVTGPTIYKSGENFSTGHRRDSSGHYVGSSDWLMYKFEAKWWSEHFEMYRHNYQQYPAYIGLVNSGGFSWAFPPISIEEIRLENFNRVAEAFAAIRPSQPDFSAVSNLYELKDLFHDIKSNVYDAYLKSRKGMRRKNGRPIGNVQAEWQLALNFGWEPLFKDVQNFFQSFNNRKKRFDQLLRDEGKSVKRARNLPGSFNKDKHDTLTDTEFHGSPWNPYVGPILETQCYAHIDSARTIRTAGNSKRVWVVGRSRYLLPDGPRDEAWKANIMRRIMGSRLTPTQIWQMIPWSWCSDYFSGLGQFLKAVSPGVEDQIVIDGGWIMTSEEYWDRREYVQFYYNSLNRGVAGSSHCEIRRTSKARTGASPFGWGLDTPSDHQVQILGILGFSKLNK